MRAVDSGEVPSGRRQDVLQLLRSATTALTIADIADRLGVHPNTVRFHLNALVAGGRVQQVAGQRGTPGRPALAFRPVAGMDRGGPRQFQLLAGVLATALAAAPDGAGRATAAGQAWGHAAAGPAPKRGGAAEAHLVDLLEELGFAPERGDDDRYTTDGPWIALRRCPFLEVATSTPDVVCPVHLGLMRGVLEAGGSRRTVERLDPFVEPDLCLAHLGPASGRQPEPTKESR